MEPMSFIVVANLVSNWASLRICLCLADSPRLLETTPNDVVLDGCGLQYTSSKCIDGLCCVALTFDVRESGMYLVTPSSGASI